MNRINLLSDSFRAAQTRRQWRKLGLRGGLALVGVGALWVGAAAIQIHGLDRQADQLAAQAELLQAPAERATRLMAEKKQIAAALLEYQTLQMPLPATAVLTAIGQALPEQAAVTALSLEMPAVRLPAPPSKKDAQASGRRLADPSAAQALPPMALTLQGMAGSDADIARFVRDLANQGLFEHVTLATSRQMEINARKVHEFRITLDLPLDRQFVVQQEADHDAAG